jgi:hypothetical protein
MLAKILKKLNGRLGRGVKTKFRIFHHCILLVNSELLMVHNSQLFQKQG